MRYTSTRGDAPDLDFGDVLLTGLAVDGGLYVPAAYPDLDLPKASSTYVDTAIQLLAPYTEPSLARDELAPMVEVAYSTFRHPDVCPVTPLDDGLHLLELFWGPTIAFKDVALQLVGRLFDHELTRRGQEATIVVATSGDTGSAAIEACRGLHHVKIVVLHPAGRVSDVQRRQMTTVDEPNVHNVAVEGTFDDCQNAVKAMFADPVFRDDVGLSAMNSINWARVMAQTVYYATAARTLDATAENPVAFSVPTGNFGNVLAGWVSRRTGTPISQLVVASNTNDILTRWLADGVMERHGVTPTYSPSMDIEISSNAERLIYELSGRDAGFVVDSLGEFTSTGRVALPSPHGSPDGAVFDGASVDDEGTLAEIRRTYEATGVILDPHTAVGVAAARSTRRDPDVPMVCLATAHPAKFPDAVEAAIGVRPELPEHLADLFDRSERFDTLPNDLDRLKAHVRSATK
ncbi:MAG: threonine synthase [Acidimicrobiales bacterium]|nr:threonine synthase [Acidimicrobiales bacterium]